jgi:carboxymethylenebutenolidase
VIGYCSGGRQAYVVACSLDLDAAVDCYGGRVVTAPEDLTPARPIAPIDRTADLRCPLLGLFGADDTNPSPEHTALIEAALRAHGKTYEFHTFENAGTVFLFVDRPNFAPRRPSTGGNHLTSSADTSRPRSRKAEAADGIDPIESLVRSAVSSLSVARPTRSHDGAVG